MRRNARQSTKREVKQAQEAVDVIIKRAPQLPEAETGIFSTERMIPAPPPKPLNIEQKGMEAFKQLTAGNEAEPEETTIETPVVAEIEDLPFPQAKPKSFDEMLKAIGIK